MSCAVSCEGGAVMSCAVISEVIDVDELCCAVISEG